MKRIKGDLSIECPNISVINAEESGHNHKKDIIENDSISSFYLSSIILNLNLISFIFKRTNILSIVMENKHSLFQIGS